MFNGIRLFFMVWAWWCVSALAHAQHSVQDGTGAWVTVQQDLRKVVSLAPHATELLYSAGAGSKIVGVTQESDYPQPVQTLHTVGAFNQINVELIVALRPDLVVAWQDGGQHKTIAHLKQLGIPVFVSHPVDPLSIADEIHALGVLNGTPNIAKQNTHPFRTFVHAQQQKTFTGRIDSAFVVSFQPIYVMSNHSFLGKIMHICGANNVFGHFPTPAIAINHEALLQQPTQIVFVSGEQNLSQWQQLYLHSPKRPEIHRITADLRPSLRIQSSLEQMCLIIDAKRRTRH